MVYDAAKPRYTLTLEGKSYDLIGSFDLIEAVEHALKDNIVSIAMKVVEMPAADVARLLAVILNSCGEKVTPREMGGLIWGMGAASDEFTILRLHLHAFLRICISPPKDREATDKQMGELLGKWSASHGETTSDSA